MKIDMKTFWAELRRDGWVGYIWRLSDQGGPNEIYTLPQSIEEKVASPVYNRIQEANFYNKMNGTSLHVKLIDGIEYAYRYDLENMGEDLKVSEEEWLPSSKSILPQLKFRNLYVLTASPVSEAESWSKVAQIFTGFNKE